MNNWLVMVLVVLVAGSWWISRQQETRPAGELQAERGPQSFINQARLLVYDATGTPGYRVQAERITHFSDSGTVTFTSPRMAMLRDDSQTWQASADAGSTDDSGREFLLTGNVTFRRPPAGDSGPLQVETDELRIRPAEKTAETDLESVVSTDRYRVESTGFRADMQRNELQLRSNVRGRFDVRG